MLPAGDPEDLRETRLEQVLAECLRAIESGHAIDRDSLFAQHPDLEEDLRSFFLNRDEIERLTAPFREAVASADTPTVGMPPVADSSQSPRIRYFGDYELLEEIARGGMGVVYKALQKSLNRLVAVKMVLSGRLASPADVQRFRQEAEAAAGLDHPHIVPIYEIGEHEGQHYFSMKLVEGTSLRAAVPELRREPRQAVQLLATIARAVHHAHQRGVLHRDLKPGNVLLDRDGEPHVTDFGLAKRIEAEGELTRTGDIVGTPNYMAPEQAGAHRQLTTAVDVYSLGAILYELLAGRPPFQSDTVMDTLMKVRAEEPVRLQVHNPSVDRDLETICLKCLEKASEKRYDSAAALADELDRWRRGEPIEARRASTRERVLKWTRRRPAAAALIGVSVASALGFVMLMAIGRVRIENALDAAVQAQIDTTNALAKAQLEEARAVAARNEALAEKRRAERSAREARSATSRLQVQRVSESLEHGDHAAALQWSVEALQADNDLPGRDLVHRIRIAKVLQAMPRLKRVLPLEDRLDDIAVLPDGKTLVANGQWIHHWDLTDGRPLKRVPQGFLEENFGRLIAGGRGEIDVSRYVADVAEVGRRFRTAVTVRETAAGELLGPEVSYRHDHDNEPLVRSTSDPGRWIAVERTLERSLLHVVDSRTGKDAVPEIEFDGFVTNLDLDAEERRIAVTHLAAPSADQKSTAFLTVSDVQSGKRMLAPVRVTEGVTSNSVRPLFRPRTPVVPQKPQILVVGTDHSTRGDWARLWDAESGRPDGEGFSTGGYARPVGFVNQGLNFVMEGHAQLRTFSLATGLPIGEPRALAGYMLDARFSPNGEMLAVRGSGFVQVLPTDPRSSAPVWTMRYGPELRQIAWSPEGDLIGMHGFGPILFWSPPAPLPVFSSSFRSIPNVMHSFTAFSIDGRLSAVRRGSTPEHPSGSLEVRDTQTIDVVGVPVALEDEPSLLAVAVSSDGRRLAGYFSELKDDPARPTAGPTHENDSIVLWDVGTAKPVTAPIRLGMDLRFRPEQFGFSADDQWLVVRVAPGENCQRELAWNARTGRLLELPEPYDHISFSPDGRRAATAMTNQRDWKRNVIRTVDRPVARVWDLSTRKPCGPALKLAADYYKGLFSPDGDRLLVSHYDRGQVYDVSTGSALQEPVSFYGNRPFGFSPDSATYFGFSNQAITVRKTDTGHVACSIPVETDPSLVQFAAGGHVLAVVARNRVQLWDPFTGDAVGPPRPLEALQSGPLHSRLDDDDRQLSLLPAGVQVDLRPDSRPRADLVLLCELLSGHRIEFPGQRRPLSASQLLKIWSELNRKYPQGFVQERALRGM